MRDIISEGKRRRADSNARCSTVHDYPCCVVVEPLQTSYLFFEPGHFVLLRFKKFLAEPGVNKQPEIPQAASLGISDTIDDAHRHLIWPLLKPIRIYQ